MTQGLFLSLLPGRKVTLLALRCHLSPPWGCCVSETCISGEARAESGTRDAGPLDRGGGPPPSPLPPGRGPHWRVWSSPSCLLGVCCPPGPRLADVCCGAAAGPRRLSGGRGDGLSRQLRSEPGLGVRPLLALHAREEGRAPAWLSFGLTLSLGQGLGASDSRHARPPPCRSRRERAGGGTA